MDKTIYPSNAKVVEVGPRDGLQNEQVILSVQEKVAFINELSSTGLKYIEAGSFVSPTWVPQMANSDIVFAEIDHYENISYCALTPNLKGAHAAINAGASEIAIFSAASEAFSQKNINCSIEESIVKFDAVIQLAKLHDIPVRAYISCAFGCPYEGNIDPNLVLSISETMLAMGCYEISLGDTTGVGSPKSTYRLLTQVLSRIPREKIALHMHDTCGQALANILIGLQEGIATFDASVAGLGGCPYAQGSSGNLATEDLVYLLNSMEIDTGIDLQKLSLVGNNISTVLKRKSSSKAGTTVYKLGE